MPLGNNQGLSIIAPYYNASGVSFPGNKSDIILSSLVPKDGEEITSIITNGYDTLTPIPTGIPYIFFNNTTNQYFNYVIKSSISSLRYVPINFNYNVNTTNTDLYVNNLALVINTLKINSIFSTCSILDSVTSNGVTTYGTNVDIDLLNNKTNVYKTVSSDDSGAPVIPDPIKYTNTNDGNTRISFINADSTYSTKLTKDFWSMDRKFVISIQPKLITLLTNGQTITTSGNYMLPPDAFNVPLTITGVGGGGGNYFSDYSSILNNSRPPALTESTCISSGGNGANVSCSYMLQQSTFDNLFSINIGGNGSNVYIYSYQVLVNSYLSQKTDILNNGRGGTGGGGDCTVNGTFGAGGGRTSIVSTDSSISMVLGGGGGCSWNNNGGTAVDVNSSIVYYNQQQNTTFPYIINSKPLTDVYISGGNGHTNSPNDIYGRGGGVGGTGNGGVAGTGGGTAGSEGSSGLGGGGYQGGSGGGGFGGGGAGGSDDNGDGNLIYNGSGGAGGSYIKSSQFLTSVTIFADRIISSVKPSSVGEVIISWGNPLPTIPFTFTPGWNLLGTSHNLMLPPNNTLNLPPNSNIESVRTNNNTLTRLSIISPITLSQNNGYWLYVTGNTNIPIALSYAPGSSTLAQTSVEFTLQYGWNLIGTSITITLPVSEYITAIYTYDNSKHIQVQLDISSGVVTLVEHSGYWLYYTSATSRTITGTV